MKKLLFIACLFLATTSFAQFSKAAPDVKRTLVGKNSPMGNLINELEYTVMDKDTIYSFSYRDMTYETLDEFEVVSFSGTSETLRDLYMALSVALNAEKGSKNNFNLGTHSVRVSTSGSIGDKIIYIFINKTGGGSAFTTLTKRTLNKLFAIDEPTEKEESTTTN